MGVPSPGSGVVPMTSTWDSYTASAGLSAPRAPAANPATLNAASKPKVRGRNPEVVAFTPDRRYVSVGCG